LRVIGKDYKEILSLYFELTGTQPLHLVAMGNFKSRFDFQVRQKLKNNVPSKNEEKKQLFDAATSTRSGPRQYLKERWQPGLVNKTKMARSPKMIGDFERQSVSILIAEPFI